MKFSQWLETRDRPIFSFWKDGTVIVYINSKRYVYHTDAMFHDRWERMSHYSPWKVLNQIKERGEQLEPPPSPKSQGVLI